MTMMFRMSSVAGTAASIMLVATLPAPQPTTLVLRNNHELTYRGPIDLADGRHAGQDAVADVRP